MLHTMDTRKMLWLPILVLLLTQQGMTKPLDATARITSLLSENISSSLQEKAEAIDTILRLLSEIDLPAICEAVMMEKPDEVTQMDNIIAAAAKEQGFESMMPTKLQTTENMVLPADFPMKKGEILPADFPMKMNDIMKPVRERAATIANIDAFSTETPSPHQADAANVIINSVQSLKPNVSLSAEARRLESQELPKLDRPELVGFKLVPSEHYVKEMEGQKEQVEGVVGGEAVRPVLSMAEGFLASSTVIPVTPEAEENVTSEQNATTLEERTRSFAWSSPSTSSTTTSTAAPSTTITTTTTSTTTEAPERDTFSSYSVSTASTSQYPEIETTTSNEIIEDISGTSMSSVAPVEDDAETVNVSVSMNSTDKMDTNNTLIVTTTETTEVNTTFTTEVETPMNETSYKKANVSVNKELQSQNETVPTVSLHETAALDNQTTEAAVHTEVNNITEEAVEMNTTVIVNNTDLSISKGNSTASTTTATTTTVSPSEAMTVPDTTSEETTVSATTTEAPTTSLTTVDNNEESNSTTASSDDFQSTMVSQTISDLDTTLSDVLARDATTLDYFWTPGKTIRMTDTVYDYDDSTDDGHTTSFHVSMSSDDVPDVTVDATEDSNISLNDTIDLTTESTPEVSTESVTAAPNEYDYIYNVVDLNGNHKQDDAYHRYDATGGYGGYDVHNVDYATEDATEYMLNPLKQGARFFAGDDVNKDHKTHGVNMLASADSPANTAAEQDFMLSAQPGYFNSLADQSSWGYHGDKLKHNSVSDDKEYDTRFTAHSDEPKDTVTSGLASAMGVRQKTVWSEPTLPQIFFQPNGYACPGLFGYYADISDCQAFFICSWGVPYRFLCPPGTLWSSSQTVCDWSNNVNCGKKK